MDSKTMYVAEVAAFLGVEERYVRRLADEKVLKSTRRSNGYRVFDRKDVEKNQQKAIDWLNQRPRLPNLGHRPKGRVTATTSQDLVTGEEACAILEISRNTLLRWEKAGRVQSVKVGRRRMFHRESIKKIAQAEGVKA